MQKININNYLFSVKVVDDPESTALGMMGKTFDKTFNAMLFLLEKKTEPEPYSQKNYDFEKEQCFWMKNCIIPLDMIFINNGKITKIHHACPPCNTQKCNSYCGVANMVLEVSGGTCKQLNIKEGNSVIFYKN